MEHNQIALFKGNKIRRIVHENEWWFSVVDVVQVLTDQADNLTARKYWNKLAQRLREEGNEPVTFCHHMNDFELIFTMLGERSTTEIHRTENSKGVIKLKDDAKAGGEIAGGARKQLEKKLKKSIVSEKNFKDLNEKSLKN